MNADYILERLKYIQDRVINARIEDMTPHYFTSEQEELSELINHLKLVEGPQRQVIIEQVSVFTERLESRLSDLKQQMDFAESDLDQTQVRLRGARAYSGKIFK